MSQTTTTGETFFVYEDWTLEQIPRCFYVGKGDRGRIRNFQRNKHHQNIIKKHGIDRRVVLVTTVEQLALDTEIELIAEHKTFVHGADYVFGANYTRGGEGTSGFRPTLKTRSKMKASAKNRPPVSSETKMLLSKIRKDLPESTRKKLGEASQRRAQTARLEWVSVHDKPVTLFTIDGVELQTFSSIKEAAMKMNVSRSMISQVLNGHRESAKGYMYRYAGTPE